jgi:SWI/SNF-related matrix-associated actin-dependent regulator of chromatin subfamily A3
MSYILNAQLALAQRSMAARSDPGPSISPYSQSNHIDLTLDDDDNDDNKHYIAPRFVKRPRIDSQDHVPFQALNSSFSSMTTTTSPYPSITPSDNNFKFAPMLNQSAYRPPFVRSAPQVPTRTSPIATSFQLPPSQRTQAPSAPQPSNRQVIDLTGSPSPPPPSIAVRPLPSMLPPDLPPKTPVCIGELTVTALVLYPVPYLVSQHPGENEWVTVRLQYEYQAQKPKNKETIHIKSPHTRGPNGENISGENFGVVEQKVADSLGPMLGKGLIRLDAKIRKGPPNVSLQGIYFC